MRVFFIVIIFVFTNVDLAFSTEYVCVFEKMLTADVAEYSSNYQDTLDVKSRSKFVFDITEESLIVNGEEYIPVFSSSDSNGFIVYSNRDFPYVMFHFYPLNQTIVMIGMQESKNDTFLKSDSLSCYSSTSSSIHNLGRIVPKPLDSRDNIRNQKLTAENVNLSARQEENIKQNDLLKAEETKNNTRSPNVLEEIIIPPPK
jgi:hypothetical protein